METILALVLICWSGGLPLATQEAAKTATQTAKQSGTPSAATVAPAIDAKKEADIRTLLELTGTKARMVQAMSEMEKGMRPLMTKALPEGDYRDKLIEAFFVKFHSKLDLGQLIDQAVVAYDRHFSEEEIKSLVQFYQTPLGKKAIQEMPQITSELMAQGQKLGESLGRKSMLEVLAEQPELEKQMEEAQQGHQPH
jgi:hypothetical protein